MSLASGLLEARRALGANRLRTLLTLLGMIIGVAAVVVVVALGQALQKKVLSDLQSFGADLMWLSPGARSASGVRVRATSLTLDDARAAREVPGVASVAPVIAAQAQATYGNNNWQAVAQGVTPEFLLLNNRGVASGRPLLESDVRAAARVVLLGQTVAEQLFGKDGEDPLGKFIRMKGVPFEVVGVLEVKGKAFGGNDQDDIVLVPLTTVPRTLGTTLPPGAISYAMIQVAPGAVSGDVAFEVANLLRERHRIAPGDPDDFTIGDMSSLISTMGQITGAITLVLGAIGAISLLVGGIGIMNIMLVTVTERTREIGIRVAIGAKRRDILLQFLAEAAAICLVGGAIGLVLGAGAALVAAKTMNLPAGLQPSVLLLAFGVSAAIGLFFGFYPARKAAQLRPVEALRAD
ncbi:MAG: ABC transporter permease [Burkholderiales bacterium]|jgi:putative ABC transport system permease protein|nr:ABC transporter permease [Burkholderiales bacterium]